GLTIVLAEHRLERAVAHADRMTLLGDDGRIVADGRPREVVTRMDPEALPPLVRLGLARGWEPLPLSIAEGRRATAAERPRGAQPLPPYREPTPPSGPPAIVASGLRVAFGGGVVLRDVDFEAHPGEMVALMGRNGSGKTTLLRALIGLQRVEAGKIRVFGRDAAATHPADLARDVGYVPQNPSSILFAETLRDELAFTLRYRSHGADSDETLARLGLADVADRHPRDLSGGERERAALAAILVGAPRALLLDEPTRGMDAGARRALMAMLERLRQDGVTVVMATHDVELAAAAATRIVMLDDGRVIADGAPRAVLSGASAFTTQIAKLYGDGSLTLADAPAA
ncbi:MAG: ATP-binding cassette domain-containing protein, partial [Thermomicrobiales bacterium]|nr:ATP-binding cassette domain-containing protein [Thermomicrobiales bacterium]